MQCKRAYEEKYPETKHVQHARNLYGTYSPSFENANMVIERNRPLKTALTVIGLD